MFLGQLSEKTSNPVLSCYFELVWCMRVMGWFLMSDGNQGSLILNPTTIFVVLLFGLLSRLEMFRDTSILFSEFSSIPALSCCFELMWWVVVDSVGLWQQIQTNCPNLFINFNPPFTDTIWSSDFWTNQKSGHVETPQIYQRALQSNFSS